MLKHTTGCGCPQCTTVEIPEVAETPKYLPKGGIAYPVSIHYIDWIGRWEVLYDIERDMEGMPVDMWKGLEDA